MQQTNILEKLVLTYFEGVDTKNINIILSTLSSDCNFTVETHNVQLKGHLKIRGMFDQLWSNHKIVCHDQFKFVEDRMAGRIAVQFRVTNTSKENTVVFKSNCNFFTVHESYD